MKKDVLNYMACTAAIIVAFVLILGGGWWSLFGLFWCGLLVASGEAFPRAWRRFWIANMRIWRYFDCL